MHGIIDVQKKLHEDKWFTSIVRKYLGHAELNKLSFAVKNLKNWKMEIMGRQEVFLVTD